MTSRRVRSPLGGQLSIWALAGGLGLGAGASILTCYGAPPNGGISATCFLRDCATALVPVPALGERGFRLTLVGVGLGALVLARMKGEFRARGGAPLGLSFALGLLVMVGAGAFVGCPAKLHLRLAGGDPVAVAGLAGLIAGVLAATLFLRQGYWSGPVRPRPAWQGWIFPAILLAGGATCLLSPSLFFHRPVDPTAFWRSPAPGYAPFGVALLVGGGVGALAQHSRLCFTTGWSDLFLTRRAAMLWVPAGAVAGAFATSYLLGVFETYPFGQTHGAHHDALWAGLGMGVVGLGAGLAQGCPLRQVIRAAQGDRDAAVFVGGLAAGGVLWHRLGVIVGADLIVHTGVKVAVGAALLALLVLASLRTRLP